MSESMVEDDLPPVNDPPPSEIFSQSRTSSRSFLRFAAVVGVGVIAVGGAVATVVTLSTRTASAKPAIHAAAPAAAAAAQASGAPLELLSLRHTRQNGSLSISGLVRNPASGAAIRDVAAVAFLFDRSGTFITSGRAALDFTTLSPGDESPFVVTIPQAADAVRYRVSFRQSEGAVIAHVDKRDGVMQAAIVPK